MNENWVERRYKRDQQLKRANELWQQASDAISESCKSFSKLYSSRATATFHSKEANIIIGVNSVAPGGGGVLAVVTIQFNAEQRSIRSKVEKGLATGDCGLEEEFLLDADEDHPFITHRGNEISLDEFSRLAIEPALFNPRLPKRT